MSPKNQAFQVAKPVIGMVQPDHFAINDIPYPTLTENSVIVKALSLSVDPYLRGQPLPVGGTVNNYVVARVEESSHKDYAVGDLLWGIMPLQRYSVITNFSVIYKLPAEVKADAEANKIPLSAYVGILGMPGQTAYGGVASYSGVPVKEGDVVVVSGAAGCVGSAVAQFARQRGAKKVIGIAGGPEKCKLAVEKYGFDYCIDYKQAKNRKEAAALLLEQSPDGYDYFFDNVGGDFTQALLQDGLLRYGARVAVCGSISNYNDTEEEMIPNFLFKLIYKSITVKGIIVFDWMHKPEFREEFYQSVARSIKEGKLQYDETILDGFDKLPEAFVGLFTGKNVGKMVVNA